MEVIFWLYFQIRSIFVEKKELFFLFVFSEEIILPIFACLQ